jgi:uncharacterized membrane protein HdeD (DUF308 family)
MLIRVKRANPGWQTSLRIGVLGLLLTVACLVLAKTTGPRWLGWVGIGLIGFSVAFLDGARQKRRKAR